MGGQHALLSPSSAERWIGCPASVRMSRKVPAPAESPYAAEGTAAHELGEIKAGLAFGLIRPQVARRRLARWHALNDPLWDVDEMEVHTDAYVALIGERLRLYPMSQLMLEKRMQTGVPSSWGTSDAVIVSPVHVEVIDFKYGAGVAVEAKGNPQLRLYACGAMDTYADLLGDTELIRITVHQPRMDHVLTDEMTPAALASWRDDVAIPAAQLALGPDAPFGPSDEACRWCNASGRCTAQVQAAFPDDIEDLDPELLAPGDLAELLGRMPQIKTAIAAVEHYALTSMYSEGAVVPGWKVVKSGGKRAVKDHEKGIEVLTDEGLDPEDFSTTKLKGIGELTKLLGAERFEELLEKSGIVAKGDGSPSLAPESDKRPSITPNAEAAKEFDE